MKREGERCLFVTLFWRMPKEKRTPCFTRLFGPNSILAFLNTFKKQSTITNTCPFVGGAATQHLQSTIQLHRYPKIALLLALTKRWMISWVMGGSWWNTGFIAAKNLTASTLVDDVIHFGGGGGGGGGGTTLPKACQHECRWWLPLFNIFSNQSPLQSDTSITHWWSTLVTPLLKNDMLLVCSCLSI